MRGNKKRRSNATRTVRNILITALTMVVLCGIAGVGYVLLSGKSPAKSASSDQMPTAPAPDSGLPKPIKPAANAPEQAAIEELESPVAIGSNTSMTVKTNPDSTCTISVSYNGVEAKDSGLTPKPSDVYGNVTWAWTINKTTPAGTWPVKVTCVYNKRSAVVIGDLQITK